MKYLVLLTFVCLSLGLSAQPTHVILENCTGAYSDRNDTFVRAASDVNGCPCYDGSTINAHIYFYSTQWYMRVGNCATHSGTTGAFITTNSGDNCDISTATPHPQLASNNCDYSFQFADDPIPTMSQWALFILGLLFTTLGVFVIQKKWSIG